MVDTRESRLHSGKELPPLGWICDPDRGRFCLPNIEPFSSRHPKLPAAPRSVCVIGSGVLSEHPIIAASLTGERSFGNFDPVDEVGHGTLAALELLAAATAPIHLLSAKVIDSSQHGTAEAVIQAIVWALNFGATGIGLSVGVDDPACEADCRLCNIALEAARQGVQLSISAGDTPGSNDCPSKIERMGHRNVAVVKLQSASGQSEYVQGAVRRFYRFSGTDFRVYEDVDAQSALLAAYLAKLGAVASATPLYEALLENAKSAPVRQVAAYNRALMLVRGSETRSRAAELFALAGREGDPEQAARALNNLGHMLMEDGRPVDAEKALQDAIRRSPRGLAAAAATLNLAKIAESNGDIVSARELYEAAAQSGDSEVYTQSTFCLGLLQRAAGETIPALAMFQSVVETGHPQYAHLAQRILEEMAS